MKTEKDRYRYQSAEFQFVGFDELTQFAERQYTYLFSRLRRKETTHVPLRMRGASNPGNEGHAWVYERFVVPDHDPQRVFIPAGLDDNPHIDRQEYAENLDELDDITRSQLLQGLWITDTSRRPFERAWWRRKHRYHVDDWRLLNTVTARWISWDTAFKDKDESDFSAFTVAELLPDYRLVVRRVEADKLTFPDLPDRMLEVASRYNGDGKLRGVLIEDAASGPSAFQTLTATAPDWLTRLLKLYAPRGSKEERAKQAAVWCKRGCVLFPHPCPDAAWLGDFEHQLFNFPDVVHDDRVDAFTQIVNYLEHYLAQGWRARGRQT
jgi:predicted phage terminase large subunit-like protein